MVHPRQLGTAAPRSASAASPQSRRKSASRQLRSRWLATFQRRDTAAVIAAHNGHYALVGGRRPLIIPDILRRHAAAAGAEAWLDELPAVVRHLEQRWNITAGGPFPGATEAYVAEAATVDGQAVVVKVLLPSNPGAARHEITALRLADGQGCAALPGDDPELGALLLERLGTSLFKLGLPVARRLGILGGTVARIRQRGAFIAKTWEMLGWPCSERAIGHALGLRAPARASPRRGAGRSRSR